MSKQPTEKKPYQSKYGGGYVNAASFIVELICEKIAIRERRPLKDKFWNDEYWKSQFKRQIILANALLKLYPPNAIIQALKHTDSKGIYSLGMQTRLDPLIQREVKKNEVALSKPTIIVEEHKIESPMPAQSNKNVFSKLKGL